MTEAGIKKGYEGIIYGFDEKDIPAGVPYYQGKVRDVFDMGSELVLFASDRISAFDRVLSTVPFKGEVLNRVSLYWFDQTRDIIKNHIKRQLSPRAVLVEKVNILPVEVIVRGYITGSAWRDYEAGKDVSGIKLPAGLKINQKFDTPILTPSTKAPRGQHDEPISCEEIVKTGLVEAKLWKKVEETALALFKRGTELAAKNGLILVDTKYEFGLLNGELILADEIHTPDSSRFWYADTYKELFSKGEKQRELDKEYFRQWLISKGFKGDGNPPEIPAEIRSEVAARYIKAYEEITGKKFVSEIENAEAEKKNIQLYLSRS
jgi:phosphoribosylaminoimidazole-succinocarboxamide synthase